MNKAVIIFIFILTVYLVIIAIYRRKYEYFLSEKKKQDLYTGMQRVHNILEEQGIQYFAIGGTLLGTIRHGEIIPWDDDIDIAILDSDMEKFNSIDFGFPSTPAGVNGCGKIYIGDVYIDIFPVRKTVCPGQTSSKTSYEYIEDRARQKWPGDYFYEDELFPLRLYKFGNQQIYGPNKFSEYAVRAWGPDWKKPKMKVHKMLMYPIQAIKMFFQKEYKISDN